MKFLRRLLIITLMLVISVSFISDVNGYEFGGAEYNVSERASFNELAFGVKHYNDRGQTGLVDGVLRDQSVNVLEIPMNDNVQIVSWTLSTGSSWTMSPVRTMAKDYELKNPGYRVIGAINGDFFDINGNQNLPYATNGIHVSGGNNYKSKNNSDDSYRGPIGFKNDGSIDSLVGNTKMTRSELMVLAVYDESNNIIKEFNIDNVNSEPTGNEISIFYGLWENRVIQKVQVNNAFVVSNAEFSFAYSNADFFGKGKVSSVGDYLLDAGDFAIKSSNIEVIEAIKVGTKIRAQYELEGEFAGVKEATGAGKPIIYDGAFMPDTTDFGVARHPRTMVGRKADGTIVMTVVDGRQADKGMNGVSQQEMGSILSYYGCVEAYNLDGGGSSTMLILKDGALEVTNSPSDGRERSDSNSLLVVAKVPNINLKIDDLLQSSLTINTEILDMNGYEFDQLYIGLNNEIKEVIDGEVNFNNLIADTNYTYSFYYKKDDKFEMIPIQSQVKTLKTIPIINYVNIYFEGNNLIFDLEIDDPNRAIVRNNVKIGTLSEIVTDGKAIFYNFNKSMESITIVLAYNIDDENGRQDFVIEDFKTRCESIILLKISKDKLENQINDLFN